MNIIFNFYIYLSRSSLTAAEEALKLKPDYEKTILRAINCCIQLKDFDKSLDYCDKYLGQIPGSEVNLSCSLFKYIFISVF